MNAPCYNLGGVLDHLHLPTNGPLRFRSDQRLAGRSSGSLGMAPRPGVIQSKSRIRLWCSIDVEQILRRLKMRRPTASPKNISGRRSEWSGDGAAILPVHCSATTPRRSTARLPLDLPGNRARLVRDWNASRTRRGARRERCRACFAAADADGRKLARDRAQRACPRKRGKIPARASSAGRWRIAAEVQLQALADVTSIPLGLFYDRTTYRTELSGVLQGWPVFWNVRKPG